MKWMQILAGGVCGLLLASGCAHKTPTGKASGQKATTPIVTPDLRPMGRVESVNLQGRFVVVSFPNSAMPATDQQLGVYRGGVKVGEIKITGPQRESNIVADIVAGEPKAQDEVKPD